MELCVAKFLMWVVTQTKLSTFLDKDILVGRKTIFQLFALYQMLQKNAIQSCEWWKQLKYVVFSINITQVSSILYCFLAIRSWFNRFPSANLVNISWEKLQKPFDKCTWIQLWMKLFFLETRGYFAKKFSSKDMGETSCFLRRLR